MSSCISEGCVIMVGIDPRDSALYGSLIYIVLIRKSFICEITLWNPAHSNLGLWGISLLDFKSHGWPLKVAHIRDLSKLGKEKGQPGSFASGFTRFGSSLALVAGGCQKAQKALVAPKVQWLSHRVFLKSTLILQWTVFLWPHECIDTQNSCYTRLDACIHACRGMHWASQLAAVAAPMDSSGNKKFVGGRSLEKLYYANDLFQRVVDKFLVAA